MTTSSVHKAAQYPPGPSDSSLAQMGKFGKDPYGFLAECARRYGDIFTLRLPVRAPHVIFGEPSLVRQVFSLSPDVYEGHVSLIPFNIGDRSLLFIDDEQHRRERVLMMPNLHGERLRNYTALILKAADATFDTWKPGSQVALKEGLQDISMRAILSCFFGVTDPAQAERYQRLLLTWMTKTFTPLVYIAGLFKGAARVRRALDEAGARRGSFSLSGLLPWNRGAAAKDELLSLVREDFERCRREGTKGRTDILALLSEARYEDGTLMLVESALDALMALLVAGYDSASTALAWALCYMLPRRDVMDAVEAELQKVFSDGVIDPNRTHELVYMEACLKEAMRIAPPAPSVSRVLRRPIELGGYQLPAGTILWPCVYLAHHRPDLWPEPETYRPERFLNAGAIPPNHYFPFGGGRRTCVGIAFAGVQMRIVLAQLLLRNRIRLASDKPVIPAFRGQFVAPSEEVYVVIEEARQPASGVARS